MTSGSPFEEFKILLIGDVRVGKTSFLTKYTRNIVDKNEPPTIGVDYYTKSIVLHDGTVVKAKIWDTAGSEKYKAITTAHYRKSLGALLFFDLTDKLTFDHTMEWLNEIHDHTEDDITIMLIGNKVDLVQEKPSCRQVTVEEATSFARANGLMYNETSAKTGHNVKEAFEKLVETIYEKQKRKAQTLHGAESVEESIRIDHNDKQEYQNDNKSNGCC